MVFLFELSSLSRRDHVIGRHEAHYRAKRDFDINVPAVLGMKGSTVEVVSFKKDELVHIEYSYKVCTHKWVIGTGTYTPPQYSDSDAHALFAASHLRPLTRWQDPKSLYSLWLLERPSFSFPLLVHHDVSLSAVSDFAVDTVDDMPVNASTPFGMPSLEEFTELWKLWDEVTLGMIPQSMLFEKPIDLRHMCLFYLGHIPA